MTFPSPTCPGAIPDGIYDIGRNSGFVNVGTDHDTGAFAVASIRGSKKDNSVYDELAKAPKKERARRNPLDKNFDVPHRAVWELIHQGGGAK